MTDRQLDIFGLNSFHNSVPVRDEPTLNEYEKKAKTQDEMILEFMKANKYQSFTPGEIHLCFGQIWPLTSVRRSLTNLTKNGHLVMTGEVRPGLFGRENNCWKYDLTTTTHAKANESLRPPFREGDRKDEGR